MKKLIALLVIMMVALVPFSALANSTEVSQPVSFYSYQNDVNTIVLEKFIYNEKNKCPYIFDASVLVEGQYVDATDQLSCSVSDNSVIKAAGNGIYAVGAGKAQVTLSCNGTKETYNVEVIDPKPLRYRLTKKNVTIGHKWETDLVQVYADMMDGISIEVGQAVTWKTMNPDIATMGEDGFVCGESKGKTTITGTINETTLTLSIKVLDSNVNEETQALMDAMDMRQSLIDSGLGLFATQSERDNIISRASYMYKTAWKPTQNLTGWKGGYTFKAGTIYHGIPYTQSNWTDRDGSIVGDLGTQSQSGFYPLGFLYALNNPVDTNFYSPVYIDGLPCPRFGNDCSGYVSAAFHIKRHNTSTLAAGIGTEFYMIGSYNKDNPSASDLLSSYQYLQTGDAVVSIKVGVKHTYIIGAALGDHCSSYEQTTYWTKILSHTYSSMAASGYMPFAKK